MLFGLAFFNNVIIDVKLPLVIYKKLLRRKIVLKDFLEIDPELYKNLIYLRDTTEENLEEKLCASFTVTVDKFGTKEVINLKENGEDILINQENKHEYLDLYMNWYFNVSIASYFNAFQKGFDRVCEENIFHIIEPEELELIICGSPSFVIEDLPKGTIYEDGYTKDSITVIHFWEVLFSLTEEKQKKFLFFVTGCDRAPIDGLGSLRLIIGRYGPDSDKLPVAHTCFNYLLIPDYQDLEKLRTRLVIAIENSEGFGLI